MIKAKYTVVLKTLMDNPAVMEKITAAMATYPLYEKKSKEQYIPSLVPQRAELNRKILNHYKYNEIGFETVGRFLDELQIALEEIMPYYNQLFFSADQDYNILFNVDYERTTTRQAQTDSSNNATTTAKTTTITDDESTTNGKDVRATEPQDQLAIPVHGVDTVTYANEAQWTKGTTEAAGRTEADNDTTATGSANAKEDEETHERTFGNFGVMASQDLIEKYRNLIINIEQQIIKDPRITELFMLIY